MIDDSVKDASGLGGFDSYVAIGDSFTEGLNDPDPSGDDRYRGWADRVAERLAAHRPGLRYANLAVRGKLLHQMVEDQVPRAVEMRPDLVTFGGGGNDMLRPGADPDALAVRFDEAVRRLRGAGARVLIFTGFDPRGLTRAVPRGKAATFNMHLRAIADRRDCLLVDLWPVSVLNDPRAWHEDRLHLSSEGHRRMALRVCEVLGVPVEERWNDPWPPRGAVLDWRAQRREDLYWARTYFLPWVQRRIQGRSSGDGRDPKRPDLSSL
ncbi:SGNH/GDSL hydrolase family protein [Thermomonospora umbrina]|uniref:Lysophospholipase L1-like esterase n=1 Tax=Thermomonospora umbrina TaxID=111806 RepID=A0A3D9STX0_9ACTN|nr:SGNH/GDSL hydrolase family protein [Thermomonospora umbrina]REE95141.1 lysophospholipase L1-like esterase [Thermomonospora umbrina]